MPQTKQMGLIQKSLKIITYLSLGATFYWVLLYVKDTKLKENNIKLQPDNELLELEKQANETKIEQFKDEISIIKYENLKNNLESSYSKYKEQFELLKIKTNVPNTTGENLNSGLDNLNSQGENIVKIVEDINKLLNDKADKFLGDNNIFEFLLNLYNNWMNMLSTLSYEQLGALAHLMAGIFLLYNLFNIIFILFGEFLIEYFKLEDKFPILFVLIRIN